MHDDDGQKRGRPHMEPKIIARTVTRFSLLISLSRADEVQSGGAVN